MNGPQAIVALLGSVIWLGAVAMNAKWSSDRHRCAHGSTAALGVVLLLALMHISESSGLEPKFDAKLDSDRLKDEKNNHKATQKTLATERTWFHGLINGLLELHCGELMHPLGGPASCGETPPLQPSPFFSVAPSACAHDVLNETLCPLASNEKMRKRVANRTFYFFGNSVTRHYAMALKDVSVHGNDLHLNRTSERQFCNDGHCKLQDDKTSSAPSVEFIWKVLLDPSEHNTGDGGRDQCTMMWKRSRKNNRTLPWSVEACLAELFQRASRKDVLVVGTRMINITLSEHMAGVLPGEASSKRRLPISFEMTTPLNTFLTAVHTRVADILAMLLRVFPGAIIVHSQPHRPMHFHDGWLPGGKGPVNLNRCDERVDNRVLCAALTASMVSRLRFLQLRGVQKRNEAAYNDFIHHAGPLSELAVRAMVGMLWPA